MSFLNTIFFVTIISLLPLLMYLFYIAHNQNIDKKEKKIVLSFVIFSSFYFLLKSEDLFLRRCSLLGLIPIIIACTRKRFKEAFLMAIVLATYLFISDDIVVGIQCIIMVAFVSIVDIYVLKLGDSIMKYHENYKELLEENMVKSSLFKIAHEVKNPLAVSLGYLEMLDINDFEQCKKYIPRVREGINHSLLIIQDFSDIGKIKIEKDIMDVNMLLEDVSRTLKLLLKEKNIKLNLNLIDDDIYIEGDFKRLTQVIINLIKNATEAINGEGEITISTYLENDKLVVLISDDGVGMSEEVLEKIMDPFFTTKPDGTGLGLFLSKEIIKKHNGEIKYSSILNEGTKVKIVLPIT